MRFFLIAIMVCVLSFHSASATVEEFYLNGGHALCAKVKNAVGLSEHFCWGRNVGKALLRNSSYSSSFPIKLDVPRVERIIPGNKSFYGHVLHDASYSWGNNTEGQLATGSINSVQYLPHEMSNLLTPLKEIAAGTGTTCAIDEASVGYCWGDNRQGQLGRGNVTVSSAVVNLGSGISQITTKNTHSCFLDAIGKVFCAGDNRFGQLGSLAASTPLIFTNYFPQSGFTEISAGYEHTCGRLTSGEVMCWGRNQAGQLGLGRKSASEVPTKVLNLNDAVSISAGRDFTCALRSNSEVQCWGSNIKGQLGQPMVSESLIPLTVPGLNGVTSLHAGEGQACVLVSGELKCWGENQYGQLGTGDYFNRFMPTLVEFISRPLHSPLGLESSTHTSCVMREGDRPRCWGVNALYQLGIPFAFPFSDGPVVAASLPQDILDLAMGDNHSCFIRADKKVYCWGENNDTQLGSELPAFSIAPLQVPGLLNMIKVQVGAFFSCSLSETGDVYCWGRNDVGALGLGFLSDAELPQKVLLPEPASFITLSRFGEFACAVGVSGAVYCWGSNFDYELGQDNGTQENPIPLKVNGLPKMFSISAGELFACALSEDGRVFCWGQGWGGQSGGTDRAHVKTPLELKNLKNILQVKVGRAHACAMDQKRKLSCWGWGQFGQIGNAVATDAFSPSQVLFGVSDFTLGYSHTCALTLDENIYCWGQARQGQSGIPGVSTSLLLPTVVELK